MTNYYNLIMQRIVGLVILFCFCNGSITASYCYPDYCQNTETDLTSTLGFQCLLTKVKKREECYKLTFEDANREPPENVTAKFLLRAYVYQEPDSKVTAFNLSITDIDFYDLVTRYQNLLHQDRAACRHIWLYGNKTQPAPKELYVSCPFTSSFYETLPYRLEVIVTGEGYKYRKQYIFNVPERKSIEDSVNVNEYTTFAYIENTYESFYSLHIQPLPEAYNVTQYRIWWINNDNNSVIYTGLLSVPDDQDVTYNFTGHPGTFYFKVSPVHSECGKDGCRNSTTPIVVIQKESHRLLIMIISTVWIPPVILYVLYHLYKLYQKGKDAIPPIAFKRREKPKCLIVYSPSRQSHVNAMIELAKYLRLCRVNAMIDMLDFTNSPGNDPKDWCDAAFQSANVVLIVTSPPLKEFAVSTIYRNTDDYLLRLIKENVSGKEKRYYVVHLPYCKLDDVPEETRHLKRFRLPNELPKLVKTIHGMERVRCFPSVSDRDFLDSVRSAKLEILDEDISKERRENEELLKPRPLPDSRSSMSAIPEHNVVVSETFGTSLDELKLLGEEGGEGDNVYLCESSTIHDNQFRVDQLDL